MASSNFRAKIALDGEGAFRHELEEMAHRAEDAKPLLRVINKLMREAAWEQFESEGARGGKAWEPDKHTTVLRKIAAGQDPKTERREHDLMASMLAGGKGNINRISKSSTTFGTRVYYAVFQGHKRQLLKLTMKDADDWTERATRWIVSGESGA